MGKHWSNQTHKEFKGQYVLSLFLLFRNLYSLIAQAGSPLALCAKALVVSRPQVGLRTLTWPRQVVPRGYVSQCQGGARVRGFSRSGKPRLLLK